MEVLVGVRVRPLPCLGRFMKLALRLSPPFCAFPAGIISAPSKSGSAQ
jgi:hypothetical protein